MKEIDYEYYDWRFGKETNFSNSKILWFKIKKFLTIKENPSKVYTWQNRKNFEKYLKMLRKWTKKE